MKNKVCLNDFFAAAAVLAVALVIFLLPAFANHSADCVIINTDSGERLLSLFENGEYEVVSNDHTVTVKVENGAVSVTHSTCDDKICVNSGEISRSGEVIVCAPALVSVEIVGEKGAVDYVVG